MRTKISATVLVTLTACFLLRMGQTHLEGLRGEPSQIVIAHSSEMVKEKFIAAVTPVSHKRIALPQDELGRLADKTLDTLPTLADFKNLTAEQVHTTPQILFQAGIKLKKFEDELSSRMKTAQDPQTLRAIASEGADFYQNCSDQEQTPSSVRAVCYVHFIELSIKSGHAENIPKNRMPLDVLTIAQSIIPAKV